MKSKLAVAAVLAFPLFATACGTARRSEALGNAPVVADAAEQRGQSVFMQHCNACHVGGAGALAPGINDKPLPAFLMRFQVRRGLGAMPAFPGEKISDAELDDLIAYLRALRQARAPKTAPGG